MEAWSKLRDFLLERKMKDNQKIKEIISSLQ